MSTSQQPTTAEQAESLVAQAKLRLDDIIELAPIGIGVVSRDAHVVMSNDALRRILGYSEEAFKRMSFDDYTHPDDIATNRERFDELVAGNIDRFELVKRFIHADGHIVWGHLTSSLLRDDDGEPQFVIGMLQDVTENRRLQQELETAEARYRTLVEQVPAVVYVAPTDLSQPWSYVSPRIADVLGVEAEDLRGLRQQFARSVVHDDVELVRAAFEDRKLPESDADTYAVANTVTFRIRRPDGQLRWIRDDFTFTERPDGTVELRGVLLDVTREKGLEEELEHLAFHDPLTQLANLRRFRDEVAERLVEPGARGAVLFLDLDGFKDINDTLGHTVGDELLCAIAERLRRALRPGDLAGRLGGDEFAVLLDEVTSIDEAVQVGERLRALLAEPVVLRNHRLELGASVGVASFEDGSSAEDLLRDADLAMYRAKDLGKDQVAAFDPTLLQASLRRLNRAANTRSVS